MSRLKNQTEILTVLQSNNYRLDLEIKKLRRTNDSLLNRVQAAEEAAKSMLVLYEKLSKEKDKLEQENAQLRAAITE